MTLYASLAEVKAALQITDTVDDSLITMAVTSASALIEGFCGRRFDSASATRYFAADNAYVLQVDDLVSVTSIASSSQSDGTYDVTWAATDYQLEPLNGYADGLDFPTTRIRAIDRYLWPASSTINGFEADVKIVGTWGFSSVPSQVNQAAVIQAMRIFKRLDSPLGVAGFGDFGAMRVSKGLDPDVAQLVAPYVRHVGVA
tara:strand:- start:6891 stop:7493 length:603 start_codon:yes stop_codon:yes gene_type:complete